MWMETSDWADDDFASLLHGVGVGKKRRKDGGCLFLNIRYQLRFEKM